MIKTQEDFLKLFDEEEVEKPSEETIQLKLEMALKQGLLKVNLGVPIMFIINKSDVVLSNNTIERKKYEEDSEFINKHIRKFAITCKCIFIYFSLYFLPTFLRWCYYNIRIC